MVDIKKQTSDYVGIMTFRSEDIDDSLIYSMEKTGVYIGEGYYTIMLFTPNILSQQSLIADDNASFYKLQEMIENELYGKEIFYQSMLGGHCVSLICYPHAKSREEAESHVSTLKEYAANIQREYARDSLRATVIISAVANRLAELKLIFRLCLENYEYFKFIQKIPNIYVSSISENHTPALSQFLDMKNITQLAHRLTVALYSGKKAEVELLLPKIHSAILTPDAISLRMLHYRIFTFLNQLLLLLSEMDIVNKSFLLNHAIFHQMTGAETDAVMNDILRNFVQDLLSEIQKKQPQSPLKSGQAENVKKYIDSNLADATLDVCQLSRIFNISQPLISSSFKRNFGCSPSDYIRQRRVELVKEYLEQTEKTLSEICLLTGFGSLSTMQRSFRQSIGLTAGRYRMQCRMSDSR